MSAAAIGARREPERPRIRVTRLIVAWLISAVAILVAAWVVPGVHVHGWSGALVAALLIAVLNAILPPVLAAVPLPFTLVFGFLLVLFLDAAMFKIASEIAPSALTVDSFWWALVAAFVAAIVSVALDPIFRTDDDEMYMLRVTQRIARRTGGQIETDEPGIVFLEIDGLGLPILKRAMRDGNAPEMAKLVAEGGYVLTEWETDLSSQTGASQAGILLGSNEDIPAFRWVEKETGRTMTCSKPDDCAKIERRRSTGVGLLRDGGASRGNLLSGEADHLILTVSRINQEKRSNPGYRAFFANGFNVMRLLVLFFWEVILELTAAARSARRDVRPRGHRGVTYAFMRAAMCVIVREEIDERHPKLIPALREHPHVGVVLVRSAGRGPVALGPRGAHYLVEGTVEGEDPLAHFSANAPGHLLRTDGFEHVADLMINSFYDPQLDEGCAFEELISFHGGLGGPQTRPFILHPATLPAPEAPIAGAAHVYAVLSGSREGLQEASRVERQDQVPVRDLVSG